MYYIFYMTLIFAKCSDPKKFRRLKKQANMYAHAHVCITQNKSASPCYNVCALPLTHIYLLSDTLYHF